MRVNSICVSKTQTVAVAAPIISIQGPQYLYVLCKILSRQFCGIAPPDYHRDQSYTPSCTTTVTEVTQAYLCKQWMEADHV